MSEETAPLLPDGPTSPLLSPSTPSPAKIQTWRKVAIFGLTSLTLFLLQMGATMEMTPLSEITEQIVCRQFQGASYMQEPGAENRCKQAE